MNIDQQTALTSGLDYASGTATRNGVGLSMAGYDGVRVIVKFAAIAAGAVTTIKAQQSSDNGSADAYSDIAGSEQTIAATDDDKIFTIDINRPLKSWVRVVVVKDATNATAEMAVYEQYGGNSVSPSNAERFLSPAEGTA